MDCLIKLIDLNKAHMVAYTCPCCREEIIKNSNEDFSNFCYRENEILKRLVSLLEKKMSEKKETHLGELWTMFQATIIDIETNDIE
jgi:acetolactate synthase small subunit